MPRSSTSVGSKMTQRGSLKAQADIEANCSRGRYEQGIVLPVVHQEARRDWLAALLASRADQAAGFDGVGDTSEGRR